MTPLIKLVSFLTPIADFIRRALHTKIDQISAGQTHTALIGVLLHALALSISHLPVSGGVARIAGGAGVAGEAAFVAGLASVVGLEVPVKTDASVVFEVIVLENVAGLAGGSVRALETVTGAGQTYIVYVDVPQSAFTGSTVEGPVLGGVAFRAH